MERSGLREKLVKLISDAPTTDTVYGDIKLPYPAQTAGTIADHLIANGVSVMADGSKSRETVEARAVTIAAVVLQAAGVCRYDDFRKCQRICPDNEACVKCIRTWLIGKARSELKREA